MQKYKKVNSHARHLRYAVIAVLVYAIGFIGLFALYDYHMGVLATIPVVVIGWLYGCKAGMLAGALTLFANCAMCMVLGADWMQRIILPGVGVVGSIINILIGGVVGRMSDLGRHIRRQRDQLDEANHRLQQEMRDHEAATTGLLRTRDHLEMIIASSRDPIIICDATGVITKVNKALLDLFGYEEQEMVGEHTMILAEAEAGSYPSTTGNDFEVDGSYFAQRTEMMAEFFEKGYMERYEMYCFRKDGTAVPVEMNMAFVRDVSQNSVGSFGILRDITQQKISEQKQARQQNILEDLVRQKTGELETAYTQLLAGNEELQKKEALLQEAQQIAHVGNWQRNFQDDSTYWSDEMYHILGYGPREVEPHYERFMERIHPDDAEHLIDRQEQFNGSLNTTQNEYRIVTPDGCEKNILTRTSFDYNEQGDLIRMHGVVQDITDRKRAQEEKDMMQSQLLQAQKMEAVGLLAGGVAHDFNNMLTIIRGYLDLEMYKVQDKQSEFYQNLQQVHLAATKAADLTRQLLLFSRKQPMRLRQLRLNEIVEDMFKMLSRLLNERVYCSIKLAPDLWDIKADRGTLEQVLLNLAVNARDAMPEGGTLTIQTENCRVAEADRQNMPEAVSGEYVCLIVSDTGTGIDSQNIDHIFEPFYSTKKAGEGTGLGLAVVYGIVQQHSGWIRVRSEIDAGTTFTVWLPAVPASGQGRHEDAADLEKYSGSGEHILLVEDQEDVLDFCTMLLTENGYRVTPVRSAGEALSMFAGNEADIDLVLTDVGLPDRTGIELVEKLIERVPDVRVLLNSGYADEKLQMAVIRQQDYPFLPKPYSVFELLQAVKTVLQR